MKYVVGIDLGGTAVNYTILGQDEKFLIEGLCEHPSRSKEGPDVCLKQIEDGFAIALEKTGLSASDIGAIGLDTPGPASATGVLSAKGSTNFVHPEWAGFDVRKAVEDRLQKQTVYLNDGNAGALWGHFEVFGASTKETSVSAIIGTGLGGGIIIGGNVVKGRKGFGGELGHVLIPYQSIAGIAGIDPKCNCGRTGDLESLCSLTAITRTILPCFLAKQPGHELAGMDIVQAAKLVRGMAVKGDALCRDVFRVQAHALGLFFDEMINTFDPDMLFIGGGALEAGVEFQQWFIGEVRQGMPVQREEQADIPIQVMPNGDTAGSRGAAVEALKLLR
jgi:predicted NBD/HSP70 family sugar kinase